MARMPRTRRVYSIYVVFWESTIELCFELYIHKKAKAKTCSAFSLTFFTFLTYFVNFELFLVRRHIKDIFKD